MFYYPAVLRHHSGCFSTIWLVATKGIKVARRDFLKVNVKRTCDDIMNYVLERVPPPRPGLPRPRFSLYLSSQLQYGVVLVYHRQCAILLEELQSVLGRLIKQNMSKTIDMDKHSRIALDLPDGLSLLEETEGALDPLFGVMDMPEAMPSPNTLIQMGENYLRESSPVHPELTRQTASAAPQSGITASPDSITLRDTEPVAIPIAEFEGEDLVDQHPETIDFLLAQEDDFPEGGFGMPREEVTPGEQEVEMERAEDAEKQRTKELTASSLELQPTTLSSEDIALSQEEPVLSREKAGPHSDQLTPVSAPVLPSPPSAAEERQRPTLQSEDVLPLELKKRKRRKRQLIFFDPETQISQDVQQQQIEDPLIETRRPLFPPPLSNRMSSAAELFNNPCNRLPEEIELLWRQAATIKPLSSSDLQFGERGPESTGSEKEREHKMVEAAEMAEREEEDLESHKQVPRDVAESEEFNGISEHGSLPLESSYQKETPQDILSPIHTSDKEGSISRSVSILPDIPEVDDKSPERAAAESPGLLPDFPEHEETPVLFQSLLLPEIDRRTVSNIFQRLLETLLSRKVRAEQEEPYGDIWILPGPNYGEGHLIL